MPPYTLTIIERGAQPQQTQLHAMDAALALVEFEKGRNTSHFVWFITKVGYVEGLGEAN